MKTISFIGWSLATVVLALATPFVLAFAGIIYLIDPRGERSMSKTMNNVFTTPH